MWIDVPYEATGLSRVPPLNRNWTLRGSLAAARLIRAEHGRAPLSAMFIHTQTISLFAAGLMAQIPTLLSLDATPLALDTLGAAYRHATAPAPVERLKLALHRRVVSRARLCTTWSRWAMHSLVQDYGAEPRHVEVIHPGTDMSLFPPRRPQHRCASQPLRVLFVGGDFERKGGNVLLDAMRALPSGVCELHVVTSSAIRPQANVFVHRSLTPHSEKLLDLYRSADVFALPTRGDCLAVVLGEAMAASLPIITTRVGGHPEAVIDGENGFLIDVDDTDALAARLLRFARDRELTSAMGARAREFGELKFDMNKNATRIANLLWGLAERPDTSQMPGLQAATKSQVA